MKQYNFINLIIPYIREYVDVCFLGGSFGRRHEDEHSNIDMYLEIKKDMQDDFFANISTILGKYQTMIFYKDIYKDHNRTLKVVYNNTLQVNIIIINIDKYDITDDIFILHDPKNKLQYSEGKLIEYTNEQMGNLIDKFALDCLDYYRYANRNDYGMIIKIGSIIFIEYSEILQYYNNPALGKLGPKNILKILSEESRKKYIDVIKLFNINDLNKAVKIMVNHIGQILPSMPIKTCKFFNIDFLMFVEKYVKSL